MKEEEKEPSEESTTEAAKLRPGIARLNLLVQAPTPEALNLIPEKLARKYSAVPLAVKDNTLRVAMANPDDILVIQALAAKTKMRIEAVLATTTDVQEAIDFNYKAFGEIGKQFGQRLCS